MLATRLDIPHFEAVAEPLSYLQKLTLHAVSHIYANKLCAVIPHMLIQQSCHWLIDRCVTV